LFCLFVACVCICLFCLFVLFLCLLMLIASQRFVEIELESVALANEVLQKGDVNWPASNTKITVELKYAYLECFISLIHLGGLN
jgi:hypothetical protein